VCKYMYIYVYIYIYIYIYIHEHVSVYIYMDTCIYIYIYIYKCVYIYRKRERGGYHFSVSGHRTATKQTHKHIIITVPAITAFLDPPLLPAIVSESTSSFMP